MLGSLFKAVNLSHLVNGCWWQDIADVDGNEEIVIPVPAFVAISSGSCGGKKLAMQVCLDLELLWKVKLRT